MSSLAQFDRSMPLAFYPCREGQVEDTSIVALAERLQAPQLMRCDIQMGQLEAIVEDASVVGDLLEWLQAHPRWREEVESTLQCLAERDGRALLTAWMSIDQFEELANEMASSGLAVELASRVAEWREYGATSAYIDGYRL